MEELWAYGSMTKVLLYTRSNKEKVDLGRSSAYLTVVFVG
jgi:hypothetical protein